MRYKQKLVTVSPELFGQVKDSLGRKNGRTKESDINKDLEENLCRAFFSKDGVIAEVTSAPKDEDIRHDVDCYVNGHAVQVKCRRNDHLTLEDSKTRNLQKYPGWLDRSKAEYYLFVWPEYENHLMGRYVIGSDLKHLLKILRDNRDGIEISETEKTWVDENWGGLNNAVYHAEHLDGVDGDGSYFELVI